MEYILCKNKSKDMHLLEQVTPHAPFLAQIHGYTDTDHIYQQLSNQSKFPHVHCPVSIYQSWKISDQSMHKKFHYRGVS